MENVLKNNLDVLKEISKKISAETSCNIIICDNEGQIIEATLEERIGKTHMGSILILSDQTDEAIVTPEQEEEYCTLGSDTRAGYNYVITVSGERVGTLGAEGDPQLLKPVVRIAAHTISIYISEYIKEKEKNKILLEMVEINEEIVLRSDRSIDYQIFADELRRITGAKFICLDLYDHEGSSYTLKAISGASEDLNKMDKVIGFRKLDSQIKHSEPSLQRLNNEKMLMFDSYTDFVHDYFPYNVARISESFFGLDKVFLLKIAHEGENIGCFSIIMAKNRILQNRVLTELFSVQVGQLLKRIQAEEALTNSERELKETVNILDNFWIHSPNPISIVRKNGDILKISRACTEIFGLRPEEMEGKNLAEICNPTTLRMLQERFSEIQNNHGPVSYSDKIVLLNGEERYYESWAFPIANTAGELELAGIFALDVTERKASEEQLKVLSLIDTLTGLYNRAFFERQIKELNNIAEYPISIISLDVDGLKIINDTMGHDKGDELLKGLAQILKATLRDSDMLSRVGGDEFIIILPKTERMAAEIILARIKNNIERYNIKHTCLPLGVSFGLATAEHPQDDLNQILKKADQDMYHNKFFQKENSHSQIISSLLSALAERDYLTQGHAERLKAWAEKLSIRNNIESHLRAELALLSKVHDIGKVGVPDEILMKPGPLNVEEWEIMRQHCEKGYRIAVLSPDIIQIADLILKHHERWDGSGYPFGLKGEQIPIQCRILAVLDSYDNMVNDKPYRKARSLDEARKELVRCSGTEFDPDIVNLFIDMLNEEENVS